MIIRSLPRGTPPCCAAASSANGSRPASGPVSAAAPSHRAPVQRNSRRRRSRVQRPEREGSRVHLLTARILLFQRRGSKRDVRAGRELFEQRGGFLLRQDLLSEEQLDEFVEGLA